eukprot:CAMPEP_0201551928 /NCGR_PEP_ID=MMETSP0173_2-20130828/12145_1 /ASSEMBLY_ACC=CAM_ASM_000268 /TAXON_ID=218659 /ORGANISM="Vexillifera sp., Strain DIVA3 564/2" /LENGTH=348 /DNA_ID=CAMNT_0047962299 /DNA_START=23 /DNA_END=1069 /DNA_ORIENTATION=+
MGGCVSANDESGSGGAASSSSGSKRSGKSNQVKILLLGTGQSGKSTIAKQLRILHSNKFTDEERAIFRDLIRRNLVEEMKILGIAVQYLKIGVLEKNQKTLDLISDEDDIPELTVELGEQIKQLWEDQGIQTAFEQSRQFQLNDSAPYFFEKAAAIAANDYVPNNDDILRARQMTTGVSEIKFELDGYHFSVLDAGGQRSQRHAWKDFFINLTAFIFVVAISEYDMALAEDKETNRMSESLHVFSDLCKSPVLSGAAVILFLNKRDIFEQKIKKNPLSICFPDYKGDQHNPKATSEYIKQQFIHAPGVGKREVFAHVTCATDTNNVERVFTAVKSKIVGKALKSIGVL